MSGPRGWGWEKTRCHVFGAEQFSIKHHRLSWISNVQSMIQFVEGLAWDKPKNPTLHLRHFYNLPSSWKIFIMLSTVMPWEHRREKSTTHKGWSTKPKSGGLSGESTSLIGYASHMIFLHPWNLTWNPLFFWVSNRNLLFQGSFFFQVPGMKFSGVFGACEMASLVKQRVANLHQEWTLMSHFCARWTSKFLNLGKVGWATSRVIQPFRKSWPSTSTANFGTLSWLKWGTRTCIGNRQSSWFGFLPWAS